MMGPLPSEAARLDAELNAALDFGLQAGAQLPRGGLAAGGLLAAGPGPAAEPPPLLLGLGSDGEPELAGDDVDYSAEVDTVDTETNTDADEESVLEAESVIEDTTPRSASQCGQSDNIRVFVRVRPPNAREGSAASRDIVRVDAGAGIMHLLADPPRSFAFDGVLGEPSTQSEVFDLMGVSVGDACLSGYNGSIYVYGQTGSGKTHTMQGPVASVQSMHSDERRGIICRLLDHIFGEIARRHQASGSIQYSCKCSYLEIYKEQITDLLEPSSTNLQVREDINRGIYVERLSEHSVWTVSDAFHVLWKGLHQRHVAATQMNELSSRSHSVFTLRLEATSTTPGGVTSTRIARLNLVDLAGSERQSFDPHNPMHNESLRVKEAGAINRSLSALTNVIMSLSHAGRGRGRGSGGAGPAGAARRPFVRYRDSKLTFLLRDSLGGNSKTVIVACVSPSALCFGETLSTLKFAARAKHIRCAAVMNEEYSGTVESLMLEVKSLKQQLELLSSRGLIPGALGSSSQASLATDTSSARSLPLDDPLQQLLAGGGEELRRLCGQRRAMRLEILLGGALERERRCELRRHKLDKFTQYLNGLLERKERYFDALRDYFAFLVDQAAGEAWYLPELTARLVVFRQQLCSTATDSDSRRQAADMLDGAMEALVADDDDLDEGALDCSALSSHMHDFGTPQLSVGDSPAPRSRSYSYGVLMGKEARRSRRSIAQFQQLRNSSNRLLQGGSLSDSFTGPTASAPSLAGSCPQAPPAESGGTTTWLGGPAASGNACAAGGGREDEALAALRAENRLLRRLLENHPELHRYSVENRLLREHLASVAKQRVSVRQEPPWPRGHKHQRRAHDGVPDPPPGGGSRAGRGVPEQPPAQPPVEEEPAGLSREKSLTRNAKSCRFLPLQPQEVAGAENSGPTKPQPFPRFPGTEDATQISDTSSSGGSDSDESAPAPSRPAGAAGAAEVAAAMDAAPFLPDMAQHVEELFRTKASLEDSLEQHLRRRQDRAGDSGITEVEPKSAYEVLRGTTEALKIAEGLLAKTKGEALWLSIGGTSADGAGGAGGPAGHWSRNPHEGLDERNVFLSLMRSLPTESPSLSCSSSAPHLSPNRLGLGLIGGAGQGMGGAASGLGAATLRPSSSTGSAGARLRRNRSTKQLHRIAELPSSPVAGEGGSPLRAPTDLAASSPREAAAEAEEGAAAGPGGELSSAEMLREAAQKARELCSRLENIGDAYRDMQEQKKPLQEEYSRTLDEGQFLQAQCRRLDIHCRLLEERARSLGAFTARPQPGKPGGGKLGGGPWQVPGLSPGTPVVAPQGMLRGSPGMPSGRAGPPADVGSPQPQLQPRRSASAAALSPAPAGLLRQQLHSASPPPPVLSPSARHAPQEGMAGRAAGPASPQRLSEELLRRVSSAPQLPGSAAAAALQQAAAAPQGPQPGSGVPRSSCDGSPLDLTAGAGPFPSTVLQPAAKAAGERTPGPPPGAGLWHQGSSGSLGPQPSNMSGSVSSVANKEKLLMDSLSGLGKRLGASFASGGLSSPEPSQTQRLDVLSLSGGQAAGLAGAVGPPPALVLGGSMGPGTPGSALPVRNSLGKVASAAATAVTAATAAAPRRQAGAGQLSMHRS